MFHMQNHSTSILVVEFLGKTAKYLYLYLEIHTKRQIRMFK